MMIRRENHPALAVEPQDVVPGKTESADGCSTIDSGMWAMPVVSMQPSRELASAVTRVLIGLGIGPFSQTGLDEALDLAVGFGRIRLGANVAQAEALASRAEGDGLVAGAVVGHDALDHDTEACVVGD